MDIIKRLTLGLVALGLSTSAFADGTVLIPSQHGGFKVGINALYLRPTSSNLSYATSVTYPSNYSLGLENNATVNPSYNWGVYAQVGYLFPCTGNDINFAYTYLNTNDNNSISASTQNTPSNTDSCCAIPSQYLDSLLMVALVPPQPGVGGGIFVSPLSALANDAFGGGDFSAAHGQAEYKLNVGDVEAGQRFAICAYDLRMFAGLRYAKLNTVLTTVTQPLLVDDAYGIQSFNSQFRGIGPRIGVYARYGLSKGFGLDADLSTALLVGTVDSKYAATVTGFVRKLRHTITDTFTSTNGSTTRIVPVIEAKLGADYTYIMNCRCKSALVFEAGYQVTNYFNVSDVPSHVIDPNTGNLLSPANTVDVAFDGPYLGVKYYA